MDCKQADRLIMQYGENTIEPIDAKNLTKHLLVCEDCRVSFVAFDICLDETPMLLAPDDFTQNVMSRVKELEVSGFAWWRAAVGFAAILVGVLLFVTLNFGYPGDFFGTLYELIQYYSAAITPILESINLSLDVSAQFSQLTFVFVPVLSVLLFVLHGTEKRGLSSRDSIEV